MLSTRQQFEAPMGRVGRATLLGTMLFIIAGFGLALWLNPDPKGYGTHQQLGLPPCSFRLLFGYPCPGCGMTTCFAYFVRGQFNEALRANSAGFVLAAVCFLLIPWCFWSAVRGRFWLVSDPVPYVTSLVISLSGLIVLVWAARLIPIIASWR